MVDERRVRRLQQRVTERVDLLRRHAQDVPDLRDDVLRLSGIKYLMATAIEACIDIAQHVVASEGLGTSESNADAMRLLGRRQILPAELAGRMAQAVAFRNLLVHEYAEVDDDRVLSYLDQIDDLDAFVAVIEELAIRKPDETR